jgi:hypothetical protein
MMDGRLFGSALPPVRWFGGSLSLVDEVETCEAGPVEAEPGGWQAARGRPRTGALSMDPPPDAGDHSHGLMCINGGCFGGKTGRLGAGFYAKNSERRRSRLRASGVVALEVGKEVKWRLGFPKRSRGACILPSSCLQFAIDSLSIRIASCGGITGLQWACDPGRGWRRQGQQSTRAGLQLSVVTSFS